MGTTDKSHDSRKYLSLRGLKACVCGMLTLKEQERPASHAPIREMRAESCEKARPALEEQEKTSVSCADRTDAGREL